MIYLHKFFSVKKCIFLFVFTEVWKNMRNKILLLFYIQYDFYGKTSKICKGKYMHSVPHYIFEHEIFQNFKWSLKYLKIKKIIYITFARPQ